MVDAVGFGDFHPVEDDEDGAVGTGVGEQLFFVFVEFVLVEVAAQCVAYFGELGSEEGVGVEGATGIGDAFACTVLPVEEQAVVARNVDVVIPAGVVDFQPHYRHIHSGSAIFISIWHQSSILLRFPTFQPGSPQ